MSEKLVEQLLSEAKSTTPAVPAPQFFGLSPGTPKGAKALGRQLNSESNEEEYEFNVKGVHFVDDDMTIVNTYAYKGGFYYRADNSWEEGAPSPVVFMKEIPAVTTGTGPLPGGLKPGDPNLEPDDGEWDLDEFDRLDLLVIEDGNSAGQWSGLYTMDGMLYVSIETSWDSTLTPVKGLDSIKCCMVK